VSIPPKISVSSFMGYLKGKSALMIFDKQAIYSFDSNDSKVTAKNIEIHRSSIKSTFEIILPKCGYETISVKR
jgi:REP element-mobilizing transposase RayT